MVARRSSATTWHVVVVALASVMASSGVRSVHGAASYNETLGDGASTERLTTKRDEAKFFTFTLPAGNDAMLTLNVHDGDADIYVLGPNYATFSPGPTYHTWRSSHAVGDDVVFISRNDTSYQPGNYRVGVWGWAQRGTPGRDGSEWTLTLDIVPAGRHNTAAQRAAMAATFRECCGVDAPGSPTSSASAAGAVDVSTMSGAAGSAGDGSSAACSAWRKAGSEEADFCHLRGNLCDAEGNIVHLHVASFGLRCELPVTTLAPVLRTVERLELGGNMQLTGRGAATLAALFSAAPNMTHLHASYAALSSLAAPSSSSSSPRQLFTAAVCNALPSGLVSIRMNSADVEGTLPSCLLAHNLHELQLQNNRLTGSIPPLPRSGAGGAGLRVVILDNNTLSGEVPRDYATAAVNLTLFSASKNALTGQLPSFNQSTLHAIRLDMNKLTGTVPGSLAGLPGMDALELSRNALSGTLPDGFFTGANLRDVSVRDNALTGNVPTAPMGANVRYVDLSSNLLSGPALPAALVRAPSLAYLYLEDNLLEGPLPLVSAAGAEGQAAYLASARVLYLARNRIDGYVPYELSKTPVFTAPALRVQTAAGPRVLVHLLDLSGNLLTGRAPDWLANTRYAAYIHVNVSGNRFSCPIPASLAYMNLRCYNPDDGGSIAGDRGNIAGGGGILGGAGTDLDNSGGGDGAGGGDDSALEAMGGVAGAAALSAFLFVFVVGMVVMTTLWVRRRRLRASNLRRFTDMTMEMSAPPSFSSSGPPLPSSSPGGSGGGSGAITAATNGGGERGGGAGGGGAGGRSGVGGVRPLVRDREASGWAGAPVAVSPPMMSPTPPGGMLPPAP